MSTIAGAGCTAAGCTAGWSGDGGAASNAQLNYPWGLAVTVSGLYVSEFHNNDIRLVGTAHCIAGGAQVLLANGTIVPIETLAAGAVVATSKGPTAVLALHGQRLTPAAVQQHVLHFGPGTLGSGLPDSPLTVTAEHGFHNPATDTWMSFGEVKAQASALPAGLYDAVNGMMVYNVALDTDDERSIVVAGLQLGSWTRGYADRASMPVVA